MIFITEYDKQIRSQSETFEARLCDAIISGENLDSLMDEAKEIKRCGFFTPKEYKDLTNIEMYKEMLL